RAATRCAACRAVCGWPRKRRLLRTWLIPLHISLHGELRSVIGRVVPCPNTLTLQPINLLVGSADLSTCASLQSQRRQLGSTTMTVSRLRPYATTVFAEMSALAARTGAVNLGQGFPDEDGPPAMLTAAQNAIAEGINQYPPGIGIAALRQAIAAQRK